VVASVREVSGQIRNWFEVRQLAELWQFFSAASVDVNDDPLADTMCYFVPLKEIFLFVQTYTERC
jgi:hypothetical protein